MMTAERWQQVKQIFQSAIERPPSERDGFISQACADDPDLRSQVQSLISSYDEADDSFLTGAVNRAAQTIFDDEAKSLLGHSFGPYEVTALIGRGGMGEVYLAQDSRLARKVALKLLPSHVTQDKQRLERFKQEARAASALNHPNILTIHEIGETEGRPFIATEFVEGETLRSRMESSRIGHSEALDVAIQIASGLNAAHEAGIVHRDIKPENIMLRRDGYVKILDFGLVKLVERQAAGQDLSTLVKTEEGVIMGTAGYMSPEQARGQSVDCRTDIWSLGVVLYEMLSGHAPFEGETPGDVIVSIIDREPVPLASYVENVPLALDWIVRKALRKEREERYQIIKDLLIDLRNLRKELEVSAEMERSAPPTGRAMSSGQSAAAPAHSTSSAEYIVTEIKQHKRAALLIGGIIIVSAVGFYLLSRRSPATKEALLRNATFTQLTDQAGPEYSPSLSPDGKSFVYASYAAGNWDIYLQRVGGKNPINLTKDSAADDTQPAFSPDGERIAFRSERQGGGIFLMGATGESVKRLTNFGYDPAWSPDGKEIACADEGVLTPAFRTHESLLSAVNVATGEKRLVTKTDAVQPNWSPHGYRIAYQGRRNLAQRDIWTIPVGGGEPVEVTNDAAMDWNPVWAPEGNHLYFVSDRGGSMNLWRVAIEEQTGRVLGALEAVTTPSPYIAHLSFSQDGHRMAYVHMVRSGNLQRIAFDPVRETIVGQRVLVTEGSRLALVTDLSPDGEWLAFDTQTDKQEDIFVVRRDGTGLRQLTDDSYKDRAPRWSPDGKRIAFFSDRSGKWETWMINADGSGLQQITYSTDGITNPTWSPDGTRLALRNVRSRHTSIMDVGKSWQEQSLKTLPPMSDSGEGFAVWSWSPDGRRLAGMRSEAPASGVVAYSLESQQYEKLTDFGSQPVWLSDSRRLLFRQQDKLYLIDSQSRNIRELVSVPPHEFGVGVTLPHDDRLIYFSLLTTEADIWMMTLE